MLRFCLAVTALALTSAAAQADVIKDYAFTGTIQGAVGPYPIPLPPGGYPNTLSGTFRFDSTTETLLDYDISGYNVRFAPSVGTTASVTRDTGTNSSFQPANPPVLQFSFTNAAYQTDLLMVEAANDPSILTFTTGAYLGAYIMAHGLYADYGVSFYERAGGAPIDYLRGSTTTLDTVTAPIAMPEPSSGPLLAGAVVALGLVGGLARRRAMAR